MNPFAAFSKAERARRYHSLPLTDKAAHSLARLFLKSRPARTFLVMYALALHFLVLVTMYVATHHLCPQALHAPMGLAHPTVVKAAASLMEGQGQQLQQMGGGGGV